MAQLLPSAPELLSDEDLVDCLAAGNQEVLGPLYARYARLIFNVANQSLEPSVAEEIVQDVFLALWRKADRFDRTQGNVRSWILQLAHWRILNELRRQSRRPRTEPDPEGERLGLLVDVSEPDPAERAWREERRMTVRAALDSLPNAQRQAVDMAFMADLTHEQVASALEVPLGTAKTRIRTGLLRMRTHLAPLAASLLAVGLIVVGIGDLQRQRSLERDERALTLTTTSELVPLRLTPTDGAPVPAGAHANYRGRVGIDLAVLSTEQLPTLTNGRVYQAWARHGQTWTSLGTFEPGPDGNARLIAEGADLRTLPDEVTITVEPTGGSHAPSTPPVLDWQPAPA